MITIQCSKLESVRKNPQAYGQLIASGDGKKGGGSHGMFSCFQDIARLVHIGELDIKEGVKGYTRNFYASMRRKKIKKNKHGW